MQHETIVSRTFHSSTNGPWIGIGTRDRLHRARKRATDAIVRAGAR